MSKDKILSYLQQNGLELRKKFPALTDARYEGDPDRMVLVFDATRAPDMEDFTETLDFKVEIVAQEAKNVPKIAGEDQNVAAWKERYKGAGMAKPIPDNTEESINPASKNAKEVDAFNKWKKRHTIRKK